MFYMNKPLDEQTDPTLRALLKLYKTEEGRQKIITILEHRGHGIQEKVQKRPLKKC